MKITRSEGNDIHSNMPYVELKDVTFGYDDHMVLKASQYSGTGGRAGYTLRQDRCRQEYDIQAASWTV